MAHVQTVLGPIEPASLGFTLPHEHTQIALWHIPSRWDYWQLTRDEPVILDELARYKAAGGTGLVDVTPSGMARVPPPMPVSALRAKAKSAIPPSTMRSALASRIRSAELGAGFTV